jgi:hypothetical protein
MTTLGKLLVYLNTFIAVVLFGWAMSLYSNRVDWFDRTIEDGKVEGQLTQLQADVKRLSDQIRASQTSYAFAAARAAENENIRDYRRYRLDERMKQIKRVDDQVRFHIQLTLPKSSLINVKDEGPVVNGLNGKPLRGLSTLRQTYDKLSDQTIKLGTDIVKARTEYAALSDQVDLVQAEVDRQKVIFENLKDEQDYLSDARINWEQQLRTLDIRRQQLQTRLETGASSKVSLR